LSYIPRYLIIAYCVAIYSTTWLTLDLFNLIAYLSRRDGNLNHLALPPSYNRLADG